MRNRRRRFLKDDRTVQRFTGAEAAGRLDLIADIEAKSWKGQEGVARFQAGPGQEILRRAFLASGSQIELSLAFAGDRPIAFQLDFLTPERLWMYQYSYDEAYSNLRAGSVLQYMSIERAWERGVREYDLMMGAESYKANRTSAVRAIDCLAAHPPTLRGYLAYWLLLAPRWKLRHVRWLKAVQVKWKRLRLRISH
jgi:CelD/BcsL family acetyltransferase involved in cellulose biosynthesis